MEGRGGSSGSLAVGSWMCAHAPLQLYVTDRVSLARDLTAELARMCPPSQVALHFEHALQGIDFDARVATFTGPQASAHARTRAAHGHHAMPCRAAPRHG